MSTISDGNVLRVFKFKKTGIVALCEEVAALHQEYLTGDPRWDRLDFDHAYYHENQEEGTLEVVIPQKAPEDERVARVRRNLKESNPKSNIPGIWVLELLEAYDEVAPR